jgi:hypothetical protein
MRAFPNQFVHSRPPHPSRGEAGIYQKAILVDLKKAVKAVGSVIAGGHLGF